MIKIDKLSNALQRLEDLGSPDAVAAYFRERGIRGARDHAHLCPVSRYLTATLGGVYDVATDATSLPESATDLYPHGITVIAFIERFDRGSYEELLPEPDDS